MQVDVIFDFAKVYDISRIEVASGQSFKLVISDGPQGQIRLFADHDEVLEINTSGNQIDLEAKEKGTSTLLIMDENKSIVKELTISVVDAIIPQATNLGLSADAPVEK